MGIKKRTAIIYKIRNSSNGKIYIGSTTNFYQRIKLHFNLLKMGSHHSRHLQHAYNKHGIKKFKASIIKEFLYISVYDILKKEQYYFNKLKPEYNIHKIAGSGLNTPKPELSSKRKKDSSIRIQGENHHNAKLSEYDIHEIRNRDKSAAYLAKKFNIHSIHVWNIRKLKSWKHVPVKK